MSLTFKPNDNDLLSKYCLIPNSPTDEIASAGLCTLLKFWLAIQTFLVLSC